MRVYYFGCSNNSKGHYMHDGRMSTYSPGTREFLAQNPWGYEVDSGLCPKGPEIQGVAAIHHEDGWTAMSFWDRSVDSRGKCNSNFLAEGTFTFEEMLEIAKANFPTVIARYPFEIVPEVK